MSGSTFVNTLSTFTPGDIVISVYGDGENSGTTYTDNQASPIVLEEIDPTAGTIVGEMALPQAAATVNGVLENAVSGEYGSSSEGTLERSADGHSLVIMGYGVNAATYNAGGAAVYGNAALAQSTSVPNASITAVPRVVADIGANGTIDSSTALLNIDNTNNPRSVATVDGSSFYIAGQGVKGDTTQGVFYAQDGANTQTAIDTSTDARTVEIIDGTLYVSRDSKQGPTANIGTYSTALPTTASTATALPGLSQSVTLTAGETNGINAAGATVALSPENYFFANATTLYVADGGIPKAGGLGDGGLQKWVLTGGKWVLQYTLSDGLNLVANTNAAGTTGLIGLTGVTNGDGTVTLYATNATIGDLDQTFLYKITDTISATAPATGESFTAIATAAADTNIRGVALAPTPETAAANITIASGSAGTGLTVTSGGTLDVLAGGSLAQSLILSGAAATIAGADSASTIAEGGSETLFGTATGDQVHGVQLLTSAVSGATSTAIATNETLFQNGTIELFEKGDVATGTTLFHGGLVTINGNATAANTSFVDGGTLVLGSNKAALGGTIGFDGAGTIVQSTGTATGAILSGFGAGDVIDLATIAPGASLTASVVGGNTVETVSSGAVSEAFTFSGTSYAANFFTLQSDGASGVDLVMSGGTTSTSTAITIAAGSTGTSLTVGGGGTLDVLGTLAGGTIASGGTALIVGADSGSTILAGGNETVSGSATGDQVFGTQLVTVATPGALSNETVFAGGAIDLFIKGATSNDIVVDGGLLALNGNATATNTTVLDNGTIQLQSPKADLQGTIGFTGAGTLSITDDTDAGFGTTATITGFGAADLIDDTVLNFSGATLTSAVVGGNTVETITGPSDTVSFTFAGTGTSFAISADATGGTELTTAPCFAAGTRILTPRGAVPVEALRAGDRVITRDGTDAPVTWIGTRRLDLRRHPRPAQVQPIRIAADSFAEGVPSRDLILSPDHALYLDGHLVPAKALVNHANVTRLNRPTVTYFHVELAAHSVIFAEDTAVESYLETGNRADFDNGGPAMRLHPDFAQTKREAESCAPFAEAGPVVDAWRERTLTRAHRGAIVANAAG